MATNYADSVNALYLAYYGRPADPAGLAFWTQALQNSNGDLGSITDAFATSAEATSRFSGESVADRISDIYQQLFNRAPDKAGLDYWVNAIQSGQLSMANAAISIMGGAQSSDAQISTAREQAAAQFTTAVAASGVAYDGEAAIQAARVLISAVTANSKPADIAALVTASTSLVQTVHDNPGIMTALANGGDLSSLLSTASGQADPVGMVQALATIGKAALTDSTGLAVLLQGGGVAGMLNSLPAGTTLHDVASAVQQGGLYAGANVATPPVETAPAITPTIAFVGTDGKDLPVSTTLVANSIWYFVDVKGIPSGGTTDFQVSTDGTTWTSVSEDQTLADGTYYIRYVVKDAAGDSGTSNALKLVMDHTVAYPNVQLVQDTGVSATDHITSNGNVTISGLHANETWTYSFDGKTWTAGTTGIDGSATIPSNGATGNLTLQIRTLENVNGNQQFTSTAFHYTVDKTPPAAPTVSLAHDTGVSATDNITQDGHIQVGGIEQGGSWEYSFDGTNWIAGTAADANGVATLATSGDGTKALEVRSYDAAGNVSSISTLNYTLKTSFTVTEVFKGADGNELPADATLSVNSPNYTIDAHGAIGSVSSYFQVSDTGADGSWVTTSDSAQLPDGLHYIRYVFTDAAGNVAEANPLKLMVDTTPPPVPTVALVQDTGVSASDGITSNPQFKVSGIETGATWDYSVDGTHWIQGGTPDPTGSAFGNLTEGEQAVQVRVHDAAGNISTASLQATLDTTTPAAGLAFDHITGGAHGVSTTTLTTVDAVFTYTGTIDSGDTIEYTNDGTTWTKVASSMIDTVAKTITLHDIDLSTSDAWIEVRSSDVAGNSALSGWVNIDGPHTTYSVQPPITDAGIQVSSGQNAHIYLTDGINAPVQIQSSDSSGDAVANTTVSIGVQTTAVQGVLGLGEAPGFITSNDATTYGFGTTGNDTLAGQYLWGYAGDDTLNVTGTAAYNSGYVVGGAGSDTIHTETSSTQLVYTGVQDSFVAADGTTAHGFDTVYVSTDASASFTEQFKFENTPINGGYQAVTGTGYTGTETGNELLAKLNTALGHTIQLNGTVQEAFVDFGAGTDGKDVGFLIIDLNANGIVDGNDYVVKIVGNVDHSSITSSSSGIVQFNAGSTGH